MTIEEREANLEAEWSALYAETERISRLRDLEYKSAANTLKEKSEALRVRQEALNAEKAQPVVVYGVNPKRLERRMRQWAREQRYKHDVNDD